MTVYRDIKETDYKQIEEIYLSGVGPFVIARRLGIRPTQIEGYLDKIGIRRSHKEAMKLKRDRDRQEHLPEWLR